MGIVYFRSIVAYLVEENPVEQPSSACGRTTADYMCCLVIAESAYSNCTTISCCCCTVVSSTIDQSHANFLLMVF